MPAKKTTMDPKKSSSVEEIRPITNRSRKYSTSSEEVKKPVIKSSKKKVTSLTPEKAKKPASSSKKKVTSLTPEKAKKPAASPSEDDSSSNESSDGEFRTKVIVVKKEIPFDEKSNFSLTTENIQGKFDLIIKELDSAILDFECTDLLGNKVELFVK